MRGPQKHMVPLTEWHQNVGPMEEGFDSLHGWK